MEKKTLLTAVFISALLLSAVAGTQLVNLGSANPYSQAAYSGEIIPPESTTPPLIQILRPVNNETYTENSVVLSLNVTVGRAPRNPSAGKILRNMYLETVYYKVDWQESNICVYNQTPYSGKAFTFGYVYDSETNTYSEGVPGSYLHELKLEGIPEGTHTIAVNATERGYYYQGLSDFYGFSLSTHAYISFTIDTTPIVSILSFENSTFETSNVPLNFTVNQSVSELKYCIDGKENVTINGNTTLTWLPNGSHSLAVYATDETGNTGVSETVCFSVEVPFPTIAVSSVLSITVIGVGLLVYFKKHRRDEVA